MNILEVEEYLRSNNYVFNLNGMSVISSKFKRDIAAAKVSGVPVTKAVAIVPQNNVGLLNIPTRIETPKETFKRFITDAEVPYRISMENGRTYTANAPSNEAVKIFTKLLNSGINYQALVLCTKTYYKSNAFKQAISNYFVKGTWESEYNELMKKFQAGTLEQHIKAQIRPSTGERKMI